MSRLRETGRINGEMVGVEWQFGASDNLDSRGGYSCLGLSGSSPPAPSVL
jgi:hypothetical protein